MKKFIIFSLMIATAFSLAALSPILAQGSSQNNEVPEPTVISYIQEEEQSSSSSEVIEDNTRNIQDQEAIRAALLELTSNTEENKVEENKVEENKVEEKKLEEKKVEENRIEVRTQTLMSNLEKILTPDQIKYFTNIVKEGASLYGVRKASSTNSEIKKPAATSTDASKGVVKRLEKIAAPWLVNQYEQIRKIGTALWGLKKGDSGEKQEIKEKVELKNQKYITLSESTCVIAAIKVKDTALQANNENAKLSFNNAIVSRTACQEAAINKTAMATSSADLIKQQKNELGLCLQAFKEVTVTAKKSTTEQHKAIWETYRNSLKSCNVSDSSELIMVEDGGGNIFEPAI